LSEASSFNDYRGYYARRKFEFKSKDILATKIRMSHKVTMAKNFLYDQRNSFVGESK